MKKGRFWLLPTLVAVSLTAAGCGGDDNGSSGSTTTAGGSPTEGASELQGSITVSAAASLTEAFTEMGEGFEAAHPGVDVAFNFDSSSRLSTQIIEGAPADVYASADEANMTKLTDENLVAGAPQAFVRNKLVIVTKPGNPAGITGPADLADAGVVALCGEEVPCGKWAKQMLDDAGVSIPESSVTRGQNVKATLTAVAEGDAVAGVVYVTDAVPVGEAVGAVEIPDDANPIATYPIGVIAASRNSEVADAFVAFVLSDEGQAVLAAHGFLPPE